MQTILITGANGTIGRALVKHLKTSYKLIAVDKAFDVTDTDLYNNVEIKVLNLDQAESWGNLFEGVDYIIHLAGNPSPQATFDELVQPNFYIPHYLFENVTTAPHVKRIIYASSIHAAANYPLDRQIKVDDTPRPTSYYGISKLYMEHLANYYAYHFQIESIGIRIANYVGEDETIEWEHQVSQLAEILDYKDFNHLIDCCLTAQIQEPAIVINGISNHAIPRLDLETARQLVNYQPSYDAFSEYLDVSQ